MNNKDARLPARQDKIWQLLENLRPIEPSSNFNALFWEKVKQGEKKSWVRKPVFVFPGFNRRLAYALAGLVIIIGLTFALQVRQQGQLSNLTRDFKSAEEMEMVAHLDVLSDFEVVQNLELLQNYEAIENFEETSSI